ncbi:hypothetical protein [Pseudomonas sp.]|uniref:hypothetical protein n=1 Tax=Pseudomonas sp. TaxID=306 RepID=UPI003D0DD0B9
MLIRIQPLTQSGRTCWQVQLGAHCVTFRSEDEARQFLETLQARLQAPHQLPATERRLAG